MKAEPLFEPPKGLLDEPEPCVGALAAKLRETGTRLDFGFAGAPKSRAGDFAGLVVLAANGDRADGRSKSDFTTGGANPGLSFNAASARLVALPKVFLIELPADLAALLVLASRSSAAELTFDFSLFAVALNGSLPPPKELTGGLGLNGDSAGLV